MKKIKLSQGKYAIVDDEDFEFLSRLEPKIDISGELVFRRENRKNTIQIPIKEMILKPKSKTFIINKNKNKLDVRKDNLFAVPISVLNHNYKENYKHTAKTSKYRGVSFNKSIGRWKGQICQDGKRYCNTFKTEEMACKWYNKMARELYGEVAYQNKIEENTKCNCGCEGNMESHKIDVDNELGLKNDLKF